MALIDQFTSLLGSLAPTAQKEAARQQQADDTEFCVANFLYYFELALPASAAGGQAQSFLIPLILGPQSISMEEPYATEASITFGGLYVEEKGILQRMLRIRSNTGWVPLPSPINQAPGYLAAGMQVDKSYSRSLPLTITTALSGQRHFQYIQDAFRTYADLKRDPAHADGVRLYFHNPKDSEDWEVKVRSFTLDRNANDPLGYPFGIDLLIVGPADYKPIATLASPDNTVLQNMRQALVSANNFVTTATAYVNQLTAVTFQMRQVFKDASAIISNCFSLITATSNFVNGLVSIIDAPYKLCAQSAVQIESSLAQVATTAQNAIDIGSNYAGIPAIYVQTWRNLADSLYLLGTHPESFVTDSQTQAAALRANQTQTNATGQAALTAAATATNPTTFAQARSLGSNLLPADVALNSVNQGLLAVVPPFINASVYVVQQGDTLMSIAAKVMGDARLWTYLALANGLSVPLADSVSTQVLNTQADTGLTQGQLSLGATIYVPDYTQPATALPDASVLGVSPTADAATHVIGTDFALSLVQKGQTINATESTGFDLVVNVATGDDCSLASGVANLQQAVLTRLVTEQGTDTLMPNLGLQPIIGLGLNAANAQAAQYRIKAALLADPRIAAVSDIASDPNAPSDSLGLIGTVQVVGMAQQQSLSINTIAA